MRSWRKRSVLVGIAAVLALAFASTAGATYYLYHYPGDFKRTDMVSTKSGFIAWQEPTVIRSWTSPPGTDSFNYTCPLNLAVGRVVNYARCRFSNNATTAPQNLWVSLCRAKWGGQREVIASYVYGANTNNAIVSGTLALQSPYTAADLVIKSGYKYYYDVQFFSGVSFYGVYTAYH